MEQDLAQPARNWKRMHKFLRGVLPLATVLLLALILRLYGIEWGLPCALHVGSYHPDESTVLDVALNMDLLNGKLLPHFYNYGSLQLYLINFAASVAYLANGVDLVHLQMSNTANWDRLFLISRFLTIIMGVGTVWVTAAIGTRLWNLKTGLCAALLLAVAPLHVLQSHWGTVDVPATFWGSLAILGAIWSLEPGHRLKGCMLSGLFAGLAVATKYNMALFILPAVVTTLLVGWKHDLFSDINGVSLENNVPMSSVTRTSLLVAACAGVGCCAAAFLIACPGFILEHALFWKGFDMERVHVTQQAGETFAETGNGFVYELAHTLNAALGLPLLLFAISGIVLSLKNRDRASLILAAAALPYSILIGLAEVRYARYAMPLLPLLCLWAARAGTYLISVKSQPLRTVSLGASGVAFGLTLWYTLWLIVPMSATDPRDRAVQWLDSHTAPSALIAFPAMPWFQTAPVSPFFPMWQRGAWPESTSPAIFARILYRNVDWDIPPLLHKEPDAVVVSEYDTMDALRLGRTDTKAYLSALNANYWPAFQAGGLKPPPGLPMADLPHDMIYADPQITVYVRRP